jgi:hypothetical protein
MTIIFYIKKARRFPGELLYIFIVIHITPGSFAQGNEENEENNIHY